MLDLFPEGTTLGFENWLTLFGQVRGDRTLLQAILDVMPGAAVDTEPRATGFNPVAPRTWRDNAALVYRQYAGGEVIRVGAGQTILLFERQAVDLTRGPVAPPGEELPPGDHNRSLDPGLVQPPAAQIVAAGRFTPGSTLNHAALTDDVNGDGRTDFDGDGDGLSDMFDD